jgi:hypothetical protein
VVERLERTLDEDRRWHGSISDDCFAQHAQWKAALAKFGYALGSHYDHREGRWCLRYEASGDGWDSDLALHGTCGAEWVFRYWIGSDPLVVERLAPMTETHDDPHCGAWYERRQKMPLNEVLGRLPDLMWRCRDAIERFRARLRD